jgi:hypothetical protein
MTLAISGAAAPRPSAVTIPAVSGARCPWHAEREKERRSAGREALLKATSRRRKSMEPPLRRRNA